MQPKREVWSDIVRQTLLELSTATEASAASTCDTDRSAVDNGTRGGVDSHVVPPDVVGPKGWKAPGQPKLFAGRPAKLAGA